jgi:hypothetical protein
VASEPPIAGLEPELAGSDAAHAQSPVKPVNLAAPLAMVVLLVVTFKAYLELVERTVASFVGLFSWTP